MKNSKLKKDLPFLDLEQEYDKEVLTRFLLTVEVYKHTPTMVVTKLQNQIICSKIVSEKYGAYDFGKFALDIQPKVLEYFQPNKFILKIVGGIQQLDLIGGELKIRDEVYFKRFTIFSSSNSQSRIMIVAGLIRSICSNGNIVSTGVTINRKNRHFKLVVHELYDWLCGQMHTLEYAFEIQTQHLTLMDDTKVSLRNFLLGIIKGTKKEETKLGIENVKRLTQNLIHSATDNINPELFTERELQAIHNPIQLLQQSDAVDDVQITKHKLFNTYTELFKKRNIVNIEKESQKAFEILNAL